MGAEESKNHPPVNTPSNYMCVVFKIPDKVQIINATVEEHEVIYRCIATTWEAGVQGKKICNENVLCFKCKGLPFETGIVSENVREVVCEIIIHLHKKGWNHLVSTNLSCNRETFTFIFVKRRPVDLRHLGYMSISSHSKLQFVNLKLGTFTKALEAAMAVDANIDSTLNASHTIGELIIDGSPWSSKSYKHAEVRNLFVEIMAIILSGHEFVCTMNVKRTQDTFLFRQKEPDVQVKTSDFFLVTLRKTKKLQVYSVLDEVKEQLHEVIKATMERMGVTLVRTIEGLGEKVEYKFKFPSSLNTIRVYIIKFLICKLLEGMRAYGWRILTGFDMCRSLSCKTELLFQRSAHLANCKVFCLSPIMDGGIALINPPGYIVKVCRDAIKSHWHLPLSQTQIENVIRIHVFNIMGSPWSASKPDAFHAHALLCHMIYKFGEKDYKFVMSADVLEDHIELDGGKSIKHDPNSWWFIQEPAFSLEDGEAAGALSVSEPDSHTDVPSVGSVLRDEFKAPPCPDLSAHVDDSSPTAPLFYEPRNVMRFDSTGSNNAANGSGGDVGGDNIGGFGFGGGFEVDFDMPPPSYEQVMRGETLP